MKKSEFESLVREIVQRELATSFKPIIRKYAKEVVNEAIESFLNSQINEQVAPAAPAPKRPERHKPSFLPEVIPQPDLAKIPNLAAKGGKATLNELLTLVGDSPPIPDETNDPWTLLGGQPITTIKAQNWPMERAIMGHPADESTNTEEDFNHLAAVLKASEKFRGKGVATFNPDLRNK